MTGYVRKFNENLTMPFRVQDTENKFCIHFF